MPFPLAHAIAALPWRRFCPRFLDFSALIIGSVIPDLASSIDDWEYFSHSILGSFGFCLPVGILTYWVFRAVRTPLVSSLPNSHRVALLPYCSTAPRSWLHVVASLLLGTWIHIGWDLFTHDHSPLARPGAILSHTLGGIALNHIIWLLSSVVGCGLLFASYLSFLKTRRSQERRLSRRDRDAYILWSGILLAPLAGAIPLAWHDYMPTYSSPSVFVRFLTMYYIGLAYLTLAVTGLVMSHRFSRRPATSEGG